MYVYVYDTSGFNHPLTFTVLIADAFTKKKERKRQSQHAKETHNLLPSI